MSQELEKILLVLSLEGKKPFKFSKGLVTVLFNIQVTSVVPGYVTSSARSHSALKEVKLLVI